MEICTGIVTFWNAQRQYGFIQPHLGGKTVHFTLAGRSTITETEPGTLDFKKDPTVSCPKRGDEVVYAPPKGNQKGPTTYRFAPAEIYRAAAQAIAKRAYEERQRAAHPHCA